MLESEHMKSFFREGGMTLVAEFITVVTLLVVFGFVAFQAYVRWAINQNFTFLGGFELEALTVGVFALLVAFILCNRQK